MALELVSRRFDDMFRNADRFWLIHDKTYATFLEHNRLYDKMKEVETYIKEKKGDNKSVLQKFQELMNAYSSFHNILTQELSDFIQSLRMDLPNFFKEADLKDLDAWKDEIAQYLPVALDDINNEYKVLEKTHVQLGRIFELQYAMKDIIHNADIHAKSGYIENM